MPPPPHSEEDELKHFNKKKDQEQGFKNKTESRAKENTKGDGKWLFRGVGERKRNTGVWPGARS